MRSLSCEQYFYGKYTLSINIKREIYILKKNLNHSNLYKLKNRLEYVQLIMPSRFSSEIPGTQSYNFEFGVQKDENIIYTDKYGDLQIGVSYPGAAKQFISDVHACCEEYLKLLYEVKLLKKSVNLINSHNEDKVLKLNSNNRTSKEDIYNFLVTHFKIDVSKESFMSEDNNSSIVLSGSFKKLFRKELTKYMIGYLFEYLFDNFGELKARVMFKYTGRGNHETILYSEAIKALNDTKRLISEKGASDRNLRQFQDNLEKELLLFINKND